jgi:hypothetical protein
LPEGVVKKNDTAVDHGINHEVQEPKAIGAISGWNFSNGGKNVLRHQKMPKNLSISTDAPKVDLKWLLDPQAFKSKAAHSQKVLKILNVNMTSRLTMNLSLLIERYQKIVSSAALQVFLKDHALNLSYDDLRFQLDMLNQSFLFGNGHFVAKLSEALFWRGAEFYKHQYNHELVKETVFKCLGDIHPLSEFERNVFEFVDNGTATPDASRTFIFNHILDISALDFLSLKYHVPSRFAEFFSNDIMRKYQSCFKLFLRLARVKGSFSFLIDFLEAAASFLMSEWWQTCKQKQGGQEKKNISYLKFRMDQFIQQWIQQSELVLISTLADFRKRLDIVAQKLNQEPTWNETQNLYNFNSIKDLKASMDLTLTELQRRLYISNVDLMKRLDRVFQLVLDFYESKHFLDSEKTIEDIKSFELNHKLLEYACKDHVY